MSNIYVSSGEVSNGVIVSSYDSMFVLSAGVANETTVNSRGSMYVSNGGEANSTTVNSMGIMRISSGGVANSTTVNSYGSMYVSNGGTANSTTVNSYGLMYVSNGGVANSTTVNGGWMTVCSSGVANSTTVNSWGYMYVSSGGVANSTTMSGGSLFVSSGGVAKSTTVNRYGYLLVSYGGTALNVEWTPCVGEVIAYDGATVTFASDYEGVYFGSNNQLLSQALTMRGMTLAGHSMYVMNGGVANETTVDYCGYLYVSSGGEANSTTVNSRGYLYVYSGGVANATTVNSDGQMYVSSGGVANETTVTDWVALYIYNGGVANSTTVNGDLYVSAGGVANETTVNGMMRVSSGGVADSTTVNSWGTLYVCSGGVANETTVSGGWLRVSSGGVANYTTVNSGGRLYVSNGASALAITENGGYVEIADGAEATFVANSFSGVVLSYASVILHSGTTADSTTVNYYGSMYVSSGGVANSSTVNGWGYLYVSNGGEANSTTVNNAGSMHVSSGGVANSTTVNFLGNLYISSGGVANSITVNYSGTLAVYKGGVANEITLNRGYLFVTSGGTATIAYNPWQDGSRIEAAGDVVYLKTASGVYYGGGDVGLVCKGNTLTDLTVGSGYSALVCDSGEANSTTVNSGGNLSVSSGGEANSTTVNSGGSLYVFSGGVASGIGLKSGGMLTVYAGGYAHVISGNRFAGAVLSGGTLGMDSKAAVSDTVVCSGGIMSIGDTASVGNVVVHSGGVITRMNDSSYWYVLTDLKVYSGGSAYYLYTGGATLAGSDTYFASGTLDNYEKAYTDGNGYLRNFGCTGAFAIRDGMKIDGFTAKGHLYMLGNAVARNVSFVSARYMSVLGGDYLYNASCSVVMQSALIGCSGTSLGGANTTIAASGGLTYCSPTNRSSTNAVKDADINISNGVIIGMKLVSSGLWLKDITLCERITASSPVISYGGALHMGSGGIVIGAIVYSSGLIDICSGGVANETTVNSSGHMYVSSGGTANGTTVNSSGHMYVSSGGTANSSTVNGWGYLYVSSGGTANGTTVNSSGRMYVSSGGTANGTTVSGYNGVMSVSNGGLAYETTVNNRGCYLNVYSGGEANSTAVNSGGFMRVSSGGEANSTTVNRTGSMNILYGGEANSTVVNSGGRMCVSGGGLANSTTVNIGGSISISSGGKVTGELNIADGAVVSAYAGSIVDFDVSHTSIGDKARLNNLALIQGAPDYTVTVSEKQTPGDYRLAEGAAGFNKTLTVVSDTAALGTIDVGETITVSNVDYSLELADGTLSLGVALNVAPSAHAEALTDDTATRVYGSDLAARWTSDTAAPGAVTLVTSDFGGDAWLDIDGAEVAGALYGASCDYSGTVNIDAKAGSIRNLAAGAAAGGSVAAVNLTLAGADLAGNAYAGGQGNVAGGIDTAITSGTFAKDFYAGALANYAKTGAATSVGDVTLTVEGGVFSGKLYGASAVKAGADSGGDTVHTAGDVNVTLAGGTAENSEFCLFGGGYATGSSDSAAPVYTAEMVSVSISGGDWGSARSGRGIYGGIFASGVAAEAAGVTISVSGGRMGNVYGGGWAQKGGTSTVGDVDITIGGSAEVANVYGGGAHSTTAGSGGTTVVNGVCITVSGGNITDAIYARGLYDGDAVTGDATVIFTGANDYGCGVFGYSYVSGDDNGSVLIFSGYTGEFSGEIGGFDALEFDGGTAVTLASAAADINNRNWKFDVSERAAELADTAFLTWSDADFADAAIALDLAAAPTSAWTLVEAAADTEYGELEVLVDGVSLGAFSLGEQIADGDYAGWGFALEDAALKFKRLA